MTSARANQANPLTTRTHCFHGHDLGEWLRKRGSRWVCGRCRELSNQAYRARQRAAQRAEEASYGYSRPAGLSLSSVRANIWG